MQELYHALPKEGGILDQDLHLLDLMWTARFAETLGDKSLSEIVKDGNYEHYSEINALAKLIELWRTI